MTTKHTAEEINKNFEEALKEPNNLYNHKCANWKSHVEEISKLLFNEIENFTKGITTITRKRSYKYDHNSSDNKISNRSEEIFAKELCKKYEKEEFRDIGIILDYQTPLKNVRSDKAGKVDLVSYNSRKNEIYFIELKWEIAKDTLLRCILEAYTYSKIVDKKKLIEDFNKDGKIKIDENAKIVPCVLIFNNTNASEMHQNEKEYPYLHKLINELKVKIIVIDKIETSIKKISFVR